MTDQRSDEEFMEELRRALIVPEGIPPGLATRIDAALEAEEARLSTLNRAEALIVLCAVFLLVGCIFPGDYTVPSLILLLAGSWAYAAGVRWIMVWTSPSLR